jgi:uncharacterized membrane protein (DUF106 family)
MFGFISDVVSVLGTAKTIVVTGVAGAAAGAVAYFAGRLIAGGTGLVVSVLVGALIVVGANTYIAQSWKQREQALLNEFAAAQAEAAAAAAEHERKALEEVTKAQEEIEQRAFIELEEERLKVDELKRLLDESEVDCPVAATKDQMRVIEGIR